jgi:hypothetical protein
LLVKFGVALLVTAISAAIAAGCGSDSHDVETSKRVTAIGLTPIPLSLDYRTVIGGVGDDYLLIVDGKQSAVYQVSENTWTRMPLPLELSSPTVGSVGSSAIVVGKKCLDACARDEPSGPVIALTRDLSNEFGDWVSTTIQSESDPIFSVAPVGRAGDMFVFYVNTNVVGISSNGTPTKLMSPDAAPWVLCTDGESLEALVPSTDFSSSAPPVAPSVGSEGDAKVKRLDKPESAGQWADAPNSDTRVLEFARSVGPGLPDSLAATYTCGPDGVIIATRSRTYIYSEPRWNTLASAPKGRVGQAAVTSQGSVVGLGGPGFLDILTGDEWSTVQVFDPTELPPIVEVAAVGTQAFVLTVPNPEAPNPQVVLSAVPT